jgi:hypothetical protein
MLALDNFVAPATPSPKKKMPTFFVAIKKRYGKSHLFQKRLNF